MATARLGEIDGGTQQDYDRVIASLSIETNPPRGQLLHVAGPMPNGWRIFDIWESEDAFRQFETSRLTPALKEAGVSAQPRIQFFPVHNVDLPDQTVLTDRGSRVAQLTEIDETEQEYDRVFALARTGTPPNGLILHVAGPVPGGFRVFNIWTSEQASQDFVNTRLQNAMKQAGVNAKPRTQFYRVHNVLAPGAKILASLGIAAHHR